MHTYTTYMSLSWTVTHHAFQQHSECADMETLEILDLEGNNVDDLGALQYLSWCPQLAVLTLADNPVAADPAYQAQVS